MNHVGISNVSGTSKSHPGAIRKKITPSACNNPVFQRGVKLLRLPSKLCQVNWTSALEFVVFRLEMPNEKTPPNYAGLIIVFIDFISISVVVGLVRAFF